MKVDDYYNYKATEPSGTLTFTREAASAFAKEIAGDFNPIHNPDARRFCVPGDLLFAVVLDLFQARAKMDFEFEQMVDDRVTLEVPVKDDGLSMIQRVDDKTKNYLDVSYSGDAVESATANQALIEAYVKFSGKTFPFLLVDLMKQHNVMINPQRPLVIYKSMSIELHETRCDSFELAFRESTLQADGKKGEVALHFDIVSPGKANDGKANEEKVVGNGCKNMLLGGLREYQQDVIDELVSEYDSIKSQYQSQTS